MEINGTASALLRDKSPVITTIAPSATVYEAIELMANNNIGALPVIDDGRLVGMFSERDYTRKVILKGRASRTTQVHEIMVHDPVSVDVDEPLGECMRLMTERRVRHLPIIENGKLVGIVSIGDIVKWVMSAQEATIDQLTKYVFGE